jgi:hypothetical protein
VPERRLPVIVNGKRVKTIDVHSHCLFQDGVNLMGDDARNVFVPVKGAQNQFIVIAERLKQMEAMVIDMEVLSINPPGSATIATWRPQSSSRRMRSLPSCARCNSGELQEPTMLRAPTKLAAAI